MNRQVLIVEDEKSLRSNLQRYLDAQGYGVTPAADGARARALLDAQVFDVLLTDLRLPDVTGLDLVEHVRRCSPSTVSLVMTAYGSLDTALQAFRHGAYDYIQKPFSLKELGLKLEKVVRLKDLFYENVQLRQALQEDLAPGEGLLGCSQAIAAVNDLVRKVAPARATVLITGESGTGKELVARAIHSQSPRREGLFVPVNVAAVPEGLMESTLFGHLRGAFTGASQSRAGAFRTACGGTLFLDEIGEMPPDLQAKLLRVLEERKVWPVGSDSPVEVDCRVVAATHRDLEERVRSGAFREDLWYRLNVVNIPIPPLRERPEDIPLLVEHLLGRYREELGRAVLGVDGQAMRCLMAHPWRGNVRELGHVLERAVALCEAPMIRVRDLPEDLQDPPHCRLPARSRAPYGPGPQRAPSGLKRPDAEGLCALQMPSRTVH